MNKDIAVIFDFNGTCIFDKKYHEKAWQIYIEELTLNPVADKDKAFWISGKSPKEILEHFLGYELSSSMIEQFAEEKERVYRSLIVKDDVRLAPGLESFLNYLLLAQIPRTICAATYLSNINLYFERYGLDRWFKWEDIVIQGNESDLLHHPHPDMYKAAINRLGFSADKTVVFEDSAPGVKAAYSAGVKHIIAVTGDSWNTNLIKMDGVYAEIKDFTELNPDNF